MTRDTKPRDSGHPFGRQASGLRRRLFDQLMPEHLMPVPRYDSHMFEDANSDAERVRLELLRRMTPEQKAQLVSELSLAVQQLAFAGIRQADQKASDDEIWLRLAARRLGRETIRKVYGFDPEAK